MPEKERARLKEQYVKELRERKQIRRTLEAAKQQQTVNHALGRMIDTLESTQQDPDEFSARLDAETALNEARLDIALSQESPTQEAKPVSDQSSDEPSQVPVSKTIGPKLQSDPSDNTP